MFYIKSIKLWEAFPYSNYHQKMILCQIPYLAFGVHTNVAIARSFECWFRLLLGDSCTQQFSQDLNISYIFVHIPTNCNILMYFSIICSKNELGRISRIVQTCFQLLKSWSSGWSGSDLTMPRSILKLNFQSWAKSQQPMTHWHMNENGSGQLNPLVITKWPT